MKALVFLGDSLSRIRDFPSGVRSKTGFQLREVQNGNEPADWKPLATVGSGVRELRIRDDAGAFRVIYVSAPIDTVLVLHAFQKKTRQTSQRDLDLATQRLKAWRTR